MLERSLSEALAAEVRVQPLALELEPLSADGNLAWARLLATRWEQVREMPGARLCVEVSSQQDGGVAAAPFALGELRGLIPSDAAIEQRAGRVLRGRVSLAGCDAARR